MSMSIAVFVIRNTVRAFITVVSNSNSREGVHSFVVYSFCILLGLRTVPLHPWSGKE